MENQKMSYTGELMAAMVRGLIATKENRGFTRLANGLYVDVIGQVYTVDLKQETLTDEDGATLCNVSLRFVPVAVSAGF